MRLRLFKLQESDQEAQRIRAAKQLQEGRKDIDSVLHYQSLPYILEIIRFKLICRHHDNLLASHFEINKTCRLVAKKYYWLTLRNDIEAYVKGYNICLASNTICHKPYGNLQ